MSIEQWILAMIVAIALAVAVLVILATRQGRRMGRIDSHVAAVEAGVRDLDSRLSSVSASCNGDIHDIKCRIGRLETGR
jgi:hypothetical protein